MDTLGADASRRMGEFAEAKGQSWISAEQVSPSLSWKPAALCVASQARFISSAELAQLHSEGFYVSNEHNESSRGC